MIKVRVPGSTSNLGPGFDTLGLALQIYLTVTCEPADRLEIDARGEGAAQLPRGEDNLVWRAMRAVADAAGQTLLPQRLQLQSEIPLSRGLGSSGAAIAAGLWIANLHTGAHLDRQQLLELGTAIEGHPENVAASLFGGLTVNCPTEQGVISAPVKVQKWPHVVLLIPDRQVLTEEARRVLPESLVYDRAVASVQRVALLLEAFHSGRFDWLRTAMEDQLHQPFRKHLVPGFDAVVAAAYQAGADGVCLSGSGSTILAFVRSDAPSVATAMAMAAEKAGLTSKTRVVEVAEKGVERTA
jgi:homoserine kinase